MYISPYRRMSHLRNSMNRMIDESMEAASPMEREMRLAVDVIADDDVYTISALVPGLEADDLNVEILNDTVTIRGEFKDMTSKETKYLLSELPTGRFSRVITLPTTLDPTKAEGNLHNGFFTLRIPKAEAHRPKIIKVRTE